MTTTTKLLTADDIWELGEQGQYELYQGVPREMAASGGRHVAVAGEFAGHLWNYGRQTGRGRMYTAEPGFVFERPRYAARPGRGIRRPRSNPAGGRAGPLLRGCCP